MTTQVTKNGNKFQVTFTGTREEAEKLCALFDSAPAENAISRMLPNLNGSVLVDKARNRGLCPSWRGNWCEVLTDAFRDQCLNSKS